MATTKVITVTGSRAPEPPTPTAPAADGRSVSEGEGGFGSNSGFNINWDGVWEVQTDIGEYGWGAEFAIPFKTLRYASGDVQTWGMNVQRNIRRRNENAYWASLERQFNLFRVFDAGRLQGLEVPSQRNLKFVPYVRADWFEEGLRSDAG